MKKRVYIEGGIEDTEMIATAVRKSGARQKGRPPYEIASLYPAQGYWTEGDYLDLSFDTNRLVELSDGFIEVLPMPTETHQFVIVFLLEALRTFANAHHAGKVLMAPLPVKLWDGTFREPDVVFMSAAHDGRRGEYWRGADLVMEVVSPGGRQRDLVVKRYEYAKAGISEYWIVDLRKKEITVLKLQGEQYVEHGVFKSGDVASSALLKGFSVDVAAVFAAAE